MAEKGIRKCISQFSKTIRPELSEETINALKNSISKCNAIALETQVRNVESQNTILTYLFDWNKVPGNHEDKNLNNF